MISSPLYNNLCKSIIFSLLFNEHLQSKARVKWRNKNKNKMWKLKFGN